MNLVLMFSVLIATLVFAFLTLRLRKNLKQSFETISKLQNEVDSSRSEVTAIHAGYQSTIKDLKAKLHFFEGMMNNLPLNVMVGDNDRKISYINKACLNTLSAIQNLLPIAADKVEGSSYDIFHINPKRQQELLSNPANLPHKTQIKVGSETLDLLMTAMYDEDNNFIGPMVSWSVISREIALKKQNEESKSRLSSTVLSLVEGAERSSEDLTGFIISVVSATEEMTSSIQEISNNTSRAASMSDSVVREILNIERLMQELTNFTEEIGEIVKIVNTISEQTNLLALNATIEASRAGEAGKGFAVVAAEVKALAKQTGDATDSIQEKINTVCHKTEEALNLITNTTDSIRTVNTVVTSIASAVEEQTAVTNEINSNMDLARNQIGQVTQNIHKINESVEQNIQLM